MKIKSLKKIITFNRIILLILVLVGVVGFFFYSQRINDENIPSSPKKTEIIDSTFSIAIPKISVVAPVIAKVDGADKDSYFKALENGVAQMKSTALPGGGSNIVIFGHSSFYKDKPGNYKETFKELDKLEIGDSVSIHYQGKDYEYLVASKKIIDSADVEVVKSTPAEQLTLLTCWPPGSTDKRYMIIASRK